MPPSLLCRFTAASTAARSLLLQPAPTIAGLWALLHRHRQGFSTAMDDGGGSHEKTPPPAGGLAERILPHLLNMYGSRATARDFEIYAPDATFEDPLMRAHGVKQIKSSFYTLPKVFGESKIVEYTVQENPTGPGKVEILIDNKQHYKVFGKPVDLTSLIRIQVEDGKVVRHEDWWNKKPLKNRGTVGFPLAGRLAEATRRGAMLLTHALMGFGKDPPTTTTPS